MSLSEQHMSAPLSEVIWGFSNPSMLLGWYRGRRLLHPESLLNVGMRSAEEKAVLDLMVCSACLRGTPLTGLLEPH